MGKVNIKRSLRRKTVSIQVMPDASITISVPFFVPHSQIEKILREKEDWIKHHQQIIQTRNTKRVNADKQQYPYLGKIYEVEFRTNQKSVVEISDKIYIGSTNNKYLKTYLESWYKTQARKIISERVNRYSKLSGLRFKSINLTSTQTRWGSCNNEKSLNFNWKLIMAPLEVIDYVVTHELAHTVELNHSRNFWETVRKMFPLYRQYRTWLKRYGHTLTV